MRENEKRNVFDNGKEEGEVKVEIKQDKVSVNCSMLASILYSKNEPLAPHTSSAIKEILGYPSDEELLEMMKNNKLKEQPKEKTYTREDVAKVLCPYCSDGMSRVRYHACSFYHHQRLNGTVVECLASDWLIKTEGKE